MYVYVSMHVDMRSLLLAHRCYAIRDEQTRDSDETIPEERLLPFSPTQWPRIRDKENGDLSGFVTLSQIDSALYGLCHASAYTTGWRLPIIGGVDLRREIDDLPANSDKPYHTASTSANADPVPKGVMFYTGGGSMAAGGDKWRSMNYAAF
jgi:hypothetical protein